jgi:hypothetical protein
MVSLKPRTTLLFLLAAVVVAAGVFSAYFAIERSPAARRQISQSSSRQPATYTELYFSDAAQLPKHLVLSGANTFGFTIANHEGRAVSYQYEVTADRAGETLPIAVNELLVASGDTASATVSFTPAQANTRYLLTVQLIGRSEAIHFAGTTP